MLFDEWQEFCYWIRNDLPFSSDDLPFSELITGEEPNREYADQQQVKLKVYINQPSKFPSMLL